MILQIIVSSSALRAEVGTLQGLDIVLPRALPSAPASMGGARSPEPRQVENSPETLLRRLDLLDEAFLIFRSPALTDHISRVR